MRKTDDARNPARFATAAPPPPSSFLVVDILSEEEFERA
jgi:hypothetical protein